MSWSPISLAVLQYSDANGDPYSGAVLKAYASGTSTPISMATDATGGTTVGSVALNASGYPAVSGNVIIPHVSANYKLVLYPTQAAADANSGALWTVDALIPSTTNLAASTGSSLVGHVAAGTGAVATTVQTKLREDIASSEYTTLAAALTQAGTVGTDLDLSAGTVALGATGIAVPATRMVSGRGPRTSALTYSGSGYAVEMGSNAGALEYGTAFKNAKIVLSGTTSKGVRVQGIAGGVVEDLYIEGPFPAGAGDSTVGVAIDGGNASNFFNRIQSVLVNHMKTGFRFFTSGTAVGTCQVLSDCSAFGDVTTVPGNGSIGIHLDDGNGNGTVVVGGNLEQCNYGVKVGAGGGTMVTMLGTRFEDNTTDIILDLYSKGSAFFGLKNLDNVTDNSGTGYGGHMIWGCTQSNGDPYPNKVQGPSIYNSYAATDILARYRGYPTQSANLVTFEDGSNNVGARFAPGGYFVAPRYAYFGIGSAALANNGQSIIQIEDTGGYTAISMRRSTATAGKYRTLAVSGGNALQVYDQDSVGMYMNDGATAWTATSDERLKDIIEPIENGLEKVASLRSVIGRFKTDAADKRRSFLIAQDVRAVLPEATCEDVDVMLGVSYTDVIPLLVAAIKDLRDELEAVKKQLANG